VTAKAFKTTIYRDGSMCFIPISFDPRAVFGKVRAPVRVTLNGFSYPSTIAAMGGTASTSKPSTGPRSPRRARAVYALQCSRSPRAPPRRGNSNMAVRKTAAAARGTRGASKSGPARPASKGIAYVALLRGINVGGNNMLPMKDLAAMFEKAGCADVRTYIQSGNVIFRADADVAARIPDVIAKAIAARSKIKIPVVVRTAADLRRVAEKNPFLRRGVDVDKLHVVFLAAKPASAALSALDPKRSPPDEFAAEGGEVFLHCPNGYGRSKLSNAYFDAKLATTSTVRNWRTVLKLLELCGG
jgi:uncharacterized protein (DUF1697 family)